MSNIHHMKNTIRAVSTIILLNLCLTGFGQQSFKVYSNLNKERASQRGDLDTSTGLRNQSYYNALSFGGISPAFGWTTGKGRIQ